MSRRNFQPITLAGLNALASFEDLKVLLTNFLKDVNGNFQTLYDESTGRGAASVAQSLVVTSGLASAPLLQSGVLFEFSAPVATTIPGFGGGYGGRVVVIKNTSTNTYTLAHESRSALPEERIKTRSGSAVTIAGGAAMALIYDDVQSRWLPIVSVV
jgi:hypothetical protein